ncbi:MAG: hypothetical protein QOF76_5399 [Solirubrobacteraceae bacterium]|jgi:hypothetical protein|nr:hypothetical protein [Solirubrobacteraceae bacterium]
MDTYAEDPAGRPVATREPGRWQAARIITTIFGTIAAIIVIAILFRVFDANQGNGIVNFFTDIGRFFVGPFKGIFNLDSFKAQTALNWGIGAAIYVLVGSFIARLVAR